MCDALGKWIDSAKFSHWSEDLLPVVYGINTRLSSVTKTTPYHVMFGQPPRSDSDFWRLVKEKGIVEEEDIEEPIDDLQSEVINDEKDDYNDCCDVIDIGIVQLVEKLSDDVAAGISNESSLTCSSPVNLQQTKHDSI